MTRVAAIDCGTNTVLLLVADVVGDGLGRVEEHAEVVRLGEGLDASGVLKPEAINRTIEALGRYVAVCHRLGCTTVRAVGTEALRRAKNGGEALNAFTAMLRQVGGTFEIIGGEREAELAWRAVGRSFPSLGLHTVLDIGGGSTELIVGAKSIEDVVSLPMGVVVLTERYVTQDPPTLEERDRLTAAVEATLIDAPKPRGELVGVAGTVTTLAAMKLGLAEYDPEKVHGMQLTRADVSGLVDMLAKAPLKKRLLMPGLHPKRADVIFAGAVILEKVMEAAGAASLRVCDRGIRWGLAYELAAATTG